MKKTAKKIALIFMVIMLAYTAAGCVNLGRSKNFWGNPTGTKEGNAVGIIVGGIMAVADVVEENQYKRAAETVSQYDDVDSF
jgi:uncharacterized membrane protein